MVRQNVLNVLVIGAAGRQGLRRMDAVSRVPGLLLVAVVDVPAREAELKELAARVGCRYATDWEAEVARDDIDIVVVCGPNHSHADMAITALGHGKDVLVEKPLANTVEEAVKIVAEAEASGRRLKTGFNLRYRDPVALALRHVRDGRIGELHTIRATIGHAQFLDPVKQLSWFTDPVHGGRGALLDLGVHVLDVARAVVAADGDEFAWVTACTASNRYIRSAARQIEEEAMAVFRTRAGRHVVLHASWVEVRKFLGARIEFHGGGGRVEVDLAARTTRLERRVHGQLLDDVTTFEAQDPDPSWAAELANLRDAVRHGTPLNGDGADGLAAQRLVFAAYASAESGRPVALTADSSDRHESPVAEEVAR